MLKSFQRKCDEKQLRILHLLHDDKFVEWFLDKYSEERFHNEYVYIKKHMTYRGRYLNELKHVVPFSRAFFEIIRYANSFDIVFIYNLDYTKSYIVNKISNREVVFIWNFFGTELYNTEFLPVERLFGKETQLILYDSPLINLKRYMRYLKYGLRFRLTPRLEIRRAISKIDYFTWYSNEEYEYLKRYIKNLPSFLSYPVSDALLTVPNPVKKELTLLLGNSGAPENNHVEALTILSKAGYSGTILIPYSYGTTLHYSRNLKDRVVTLNLNVIFLEDFMPYEKYSKLMSECSVAIYNSYRQMALGNIFMSLANGTKVYLSEKNPSYRWLLNLGFQIYSVETQLKNDLLCKNLMLSEAEGEQNKLKYQEITNARFTDIFLNNLQNMKKNK
jgi:dTDP-N-acetylfucosamine:lipid II N-acetylfucosaminyltransferase